MPWIENCAKHEVAKALHHDPGPNNLLICIDDLNCTWVKPKFSFRETHKFEFLDLETSDLSWCPQEALISDQQAEQLVEILQHALHNNTNVVVHCTAGICRSGAVVEVAVAMGFQDLEKWRSPNLLVKHKMMKVLGLEFDPLETHKIRDEF